MIQIKIYSVYFPQSVFYPWFAVCSLHFTLTSVDSFMAIWVIKQFKLRLFKGVGCHQKESSVSELSGKNNFNLV